MHQQIKLIRLRRHASFSMKSIFIILLSCAQFTSGSQLRIETVTQPLYLHGSESDSLISFQAVPYVTFASDPEWRFPAISSPFIPPSDSSSPSHDVNLASLYRIAIHGTYKKNDKDFLVTVDASKAIQPEGYPFTVDQVIDAVVTCVKIMYPHRPSDEGVLEIVISRGGGKPKATK